MDFILNLITSLLIMFGSLGLFAFGSQTVESFFGKRNIVPTEEQLKTFNKIKTRYSFISLCFIILGIGIIIARIFS